MAYYSKVAIEVGKNLKQKIEFALGEYWYESEGKAKDMPETFEEIFREGRAKIYYWSDVVWSLATRQIPNKIALILHEAADVEDPYDLDNAYKFIRIGENDGDIQISYNDPGEYFFGELYPVTEINIPDNKTCQLPTP